MRTLRGAAAALLLAVPSLVLSTPARAQSSPTSSPMIVLDGTRTPQTLCAFRLVNGSLVECKIAVDASGAVINPATKELQQSLITALGSPFQAGGSIGNTAFGVTGPLPAGTNTLGKVGIDPANNGVTVSSSALPAGAATDASIQTVSGAIGAKTDAKSTATDGTPASEIALLKGQIDRLQAIVTTLGAPFQSGASIGNTRFGIDVSGTVVSNANQLPVIGYCSAVTGTLSWTVGNPYLLPCDPAGRLRVGLSSAATIGTTTATTADLAGFNDPNGHQAPGNVDGSGNLKTVDSDHSASGISAAIGTGGALTLAAPVLGRPIMVYAPAACTVTLSRKRTSGATASPVVRSDGSAITLSFSAEGQTLLPYVEYVSGAQLVFTPSTSVNIEVAQ